MKRPESLQLSYEEKREFRILTDVLDVEIEEDMKPTDGWDPTPRPFELDHITTNTDSQRRAIPPGHIALMGDFEPKCKQ